MARIVLDNIVPSTVPINGWKVGYRVKNSGGPFLIISPNPTSQPIIINTDDPEGTQYEGYIQSDCGNGNLSTQYNWQIACNPVTGLQATATLDTITVNWNAVAGADHYQFKYKKTGSSIWLGSGDTSTTSTVINGLEAGTMYDVVIQTVCTNNAISLETYITVSTTTQPVCNPVTNLIAQPISSTAIRVSWQGVNGAQNYSVEYKKDTDSTWLPLPSSSNTTVDVTNLDPNTLYNFRVTTHCTNGITSSPTLVNGTTSENTCPPVTGLGVSNIQSNSMTLNWTAVSGADYYIVEYQPEGGTWTTMPNVTGTSLVFGSQYILEGKKYNFKVSTHCSNGLTSAATPISANSLCLPTTGFTIGTVTYTSLTVDAPVNDIQYKIEYRKQGDPTWILFADNYTIVGGQFKITDLTDGTTYEIRIAKICTSGDTSTPQILTGSTAVCTKVTETLTLPPLGSTYTDYRSIPCKDGLYVVEYNIDSTGLVSGDALNIEVYNGATLIGSLYGAPVSITEGSFTFEYDAAPNADDCQYTILYYISRPTFISEFGGATADVMCNIEESKIVFTPSNTPDIPAVGQHLYSDGRMLDPVEGNNLWYAYYSTQSDKYIVQLDNSGIITNVFTCTVPPPALPYNLIFANGGNSPYESDSFADAFGGTGTTRVWTDANGSLGNFEAGWVVDALPNGKGDAQFANIAPGTYNFKLLIGILIPSAFPAPRRRLRVYKNGDLMIDKKAHFPQPGVFPWNTGDITITSTDRILIRLN